MLTGGATGCELVPKLRRLILVIPLEVLRPRAEIALLGARWVFIAADAGDEGVPLVLRHDLLKCRGLQFVCHRDRIGGVITNRPALRVGPGACAGIFIDLNDEVEAMVLHRPISVRKHLRELIGGIDMQQGIRDMPAECLLRKPDQHVRVLAHAPRHADVLEIMKRLADQEHTLRLERIKV